MKKFTPSMTKISRKIKTGRDLLDWLKNENKKLTDIYFESDIDGHIFSVYTRLPTIEEAKEQRIVYEETILRNELLFKK